MKKILILLIGFLIAVAFITSAAFGQVVDYKLTEDVYKPVQIIEHFDTTVIYKGIDTCKHFHKWAEHENPLPYPVDQCMQYHTPAGCPNSWLDINRVCTICLRVERIKETRTTTTYTDPYADALRRLSKRGVVVFCYKCIE